MIDETIAMVIIVVRHVILTTLEIRDKLLEAIISAKIMDCLVAVELEITALPALVELYPAMKGITN
jgi:hypothetical protein